MADRSGGGSGAGEVSLGPVASLECSAPRTYRYARSHRIAEVFGLIFGTSLLLETAWLSFQRLPAAAHGSALLSACAGLCLADLISGVVHWSADSYGHARMPIFGGSVRTFREHHADPLDITRHDAIETNGDVFIFSSPVHFLLLCSVQNPLVLALIFGVFSGSYCNSQIHKWAPSERPPRWLRALQRSRLLLSPEHHRQLHQGAHESHYCITTGWMNPILDRVRFFRGLEIALAKLGLHRTN